MQVDRINFQKVFPTGVYQNIKIGVEATLDAHETPEEAFTKAEILVNHWFAAAYPNVGESVTYKEPETNHEDKRVEMFISEINGCTKINDVNAFGIEQGLASYFKVSESDLRIKAAYDLKTLQLNNQK